MTGADVLAAAAAGRSMFVCSICGGLALCDVTPPVSSVKQDGLPPMLCTACETCCHAFAEVESAGVACILTPVWMREAHARGDDPVAFAIAAGRAQLPKSRHLRSIP